jgi:SSS family solute:Na+ symporter
LRGLFLAALFGAIQSTVNSVLNSTSTVCTLDIYKRLIFKNASERDLVKMGMWSSVVILVLAIILAGFIGQLEGSLFVYVQTLYAFFAAPFAAIFLLGILFRRINGQGATAAVIVGFAFGAALKIYVELPGHVVWLEPFGMQAIFTWLVSMLTCVVGSLLTSRPSPEKVSDQVTFNWRKLNIFEDLGSRWYTHVVLWWGLFCVIIVLLMLVFSGAYL